MHVQLSGASSPCASPGEEDRNAEALVLDQVLFLYPETLTFEELVREIGKGLADEAHRDQVDRAIRELSAAGLLHSNGDRILPTRAACYFADIAPFV